MAKAAFDSELASTSAPLQILDSVADGYCDPVTGVCMLPGAAPPEVPRGDAGGKTAETVANPGRPEEQGQSHSPAAGLREGKDRACEESSRPATLVVPQSNGSFP